ncbi:MAG: hypothetical protein IJU49_01350 [Lachnospiraceae bacterium]|nr:hypothetical protein [Lachnospiraceae bacterium]
MGLAKNYFKDFDVEERIDAKGRRKKILIYKGNTWTMKVDQEKLLPRKIAFLAIALLMAGAGIAGNLQNAAGNRAGVAAAAGLIAFVPMFLVLYSCIYSLILKTPVLQRAQYRETSLFMKIGSAAVCIFALTAMIGHIVLAIVGAIPGERSLEVLSAILWGVAALASAVLFIWEMKTEYVQKRKDGTIVRKERFRRGSETY